MGSAMEPKVTYSELQTEITASKKKKKKNLSDISGSSFEYRRVFSLTRLPRSSLLEQARASSA